MYTGVCEEWPGKHLQAKRLREADWKPWKPRNINVHMYVYICIYVHSSNDFSMHNSNANTNTTYIYIYIYTHTYICTHSYIHDVLLSLTYN